MRPRRIRLKPTKEQIQVVYDRLMSGASVEEAIADVDIYRAGTWYWLNKFGFKLPHRRSLNKYLNSDEWVRSAHQTLESGRSLKELQKAIGASSSQIATAFERLGLSNSREAQKTGKLARIARNISDITIALETDKPENIAKKLRVGRDFLRQNLADNNQLKVNHFKGKDVWLSEIPPEAVVEAFRKVEKRESTYKKEAQRYNVTAKTLQRLAVRLGLRIVRPYTETSPWKSHVTQIQVYMVYDMFMDGVQTIGKSCEILDISAVTMRTMFVRLGLREERILRIPGVEPTRKETLLSREERCTHSGRTPPMTSTSQESIAADPVG